MMHMCRFGLSLGSHNSTGSQIRAHKSQRGTTAGPVRYYRRAVLPLILSGTTAESYYRFSSGTTVTPNTNTIPTGLPCSPLSGLLHLIVFLFCVFYFWAWSGDGPPRRHVKRKTQAS